jgi:hypothetical protein
MLLAWPDRRKFICCGGDEVPLHSRMQVAQGKIRFTGGVGCISWTSRGQASSSCQHQRDGREHPEYCVDIILPKPLSVYFPDVDPARLAAPGCSVSHVIIGRQSRHVSPHHRLECSVMSWAHVPHRSTELRASWMRCILSANLTALSPVMNSRYDQLFLSPSHSATGRNYFPVRPHLSALPHLPCSRSWHKR